MLNLAILSGGRKLPVQLAKAHPKALRISFAGVPHQHEAPTLEHMFEKLGALLEDLRNNNISDVVLAGSMSRPPLDAQAFDDFMVGAAPRLLAAFQQGDDALLRLVIDLFEEQGFTVRGAHELLPDLTLPEGVIGPEPSDQDMADAARAADILLALSPLDLGQGVVVASGLCLGIETLQGTDALLGFVAQTSAALRRGKGVLVKAPKKGQDLRVDMPAIGPETIYAASRAGLAGVVIPAGRVIVLDREATQKALADTGLFLKVQVL